MSGCGELLDRGRYVAPIGDLVRIDRQNAVAGLETGARRGAVCLHGADHRGQRPLARLEADLAIHAFLIEVAGQLRQRQGALAFGAAGIDDGHTEIAAIHAALQQRHAGIGPGLDRIAVDRGDAVAALETCTRGDMIDMADKRLVIGLADHEHQPECGQREDQVERRAGRADRHAHADRLAVVRVLQILRIDGVGGLAFIEHLHVAAERNRCDDELGAVTVETLTTAPARNRSRT